jgi:hypothetical protein
VLAVHVVIDAAEFSTFVVISLTIKKQRPCELLLNTGVAEPHHCNAVLDTNFNETQSPERCCTTCPHPTDEQF